MNPLKNLNLEFLINSLILKLLISSKDVQLHQKIGLKTKIKKLESRKEMEDHYYNQKILHLFH